ncbi:MAG: hypothetical protein WA802_08550 [Terracidiphilus sp.]
MNSTSRNSTSGAPHERDSGSAEATLRLIARLPAPQGLEERVNAGLRSAPRTGRVLQWPNALRPTSSWMRGAAAAAIVFVVAGGGWGIYMRVQPSQPARVIAMPPRVGAGFSSAGAMRTPQTLNGPVVAAPVARQAGDAQAGTLQAAPARTLQKAPAQVVPITQNQSKMLARNKASAQPAVSAAK